MARVRKRFGVNPEVVIIRNQPVQFDEKGIAEVTDEEQLGLIKRIQQSTGQFEVIEEEDKPKKGKAEPSEAPSSEEEAAPKKRTRKKAE